MKTTCTPLFTLALTGAFTAAAAQAQTVFIDDDFEVNSSSSYTIVDDGTPNGSQMFAFDYSTVGIAPAPRSAPGETRGLRLTANDSAGAVDAWTLFHNTNIAADRYRMTVDVFMHFMQGSFTTEHAHIGVGGDGVTPNQYANAATGTTGSGAYLCFTGDGGSASDYRWYRDAANLPAGEVASGVLPGTHPSYLGHGANASDPFFLSLFPNPPATIAGSPGNIWTTVEIVVDNLAGSIQMYFDGTLVFDGAFAGSLNGRASLGLCDIFTSVSGSLDVFTLYDNFTVESITGGLGTVYCNSVANSTGATGQIAASGLFAASANNVTLSASDLPNNSFGFFLTSQMQGMVNQPGGSQGVLCLGGAVGRYVGPGQIQNSGTTGGFALALNLTQTPTPTGFVSVSAGQTWNYQAWFRDAVSGVATSNFTDAIEVTFN